MTIEANSQAQPDAAADLEQDILDTLSLSDLAPQPEPNSQPEAPAASAAGEEGGVGSAPSPSETSSSTGSEGQSQPAAPAPTEGQPPASGEQPAPALVPSEQQPAAPTPSQPAAESPAEAALRTASLEAQIAALRQTIDELRANPQQPPAGQPAGTPASAETGGAAPAEQPLRYNLTLPDATRNALLSDDPQQNIAAINAIVNDLGTIVHNSVVAQMRNEFRGAIANLASMTQQTDTATAQETARTAAREAYFSAFPAHKNELIEPIIAQQARQLSAEYPGLNWDEQYINALGARVNAALEKIGVPAQQQPAESQTPGGQPPSQPAGFVPSGTRGGAGSPPATGSDLSDEIFGTLDPFAG